MKTPCFNCKCRSIGCHTNCPGYAAYKQQLEKRKESDREYETKRFAKWR